MAQNQGLLLFILGICSGWKNFKNGIIIIIEFKYFFYICISKI